MRAMKASSSSSSWRAASLGRRATRQTALTTNVAASSAIASPGPVSATTTPATAGPATLATLRVTPSSALACCRRSGGTVCGISPMSAGMNTAAAVP